MLCIQYHARQCVKPIFLLRTHNPARFRDRVALTMAKKQKKQLSVVTSLMEKASANTSIKTASDDIASPEHSARTLDTTCIDR